jgi:hypothetical protein
MVSIHVFAVLFSLVVVFIADKGALAWMRGKQQLMSARRVRVLHALTWGALTVLVISGAIIAFPMLNYLLTQPLFIMKMLFVAVLLVNAVLIGKLSEYAVREPFAQLTHHDRMRLITSGTVSSFSWIATIILALLVFK